MGGGSHYPGRVATSAVAFQVSSINELIHSIDLGTALGFRTWIKRAIQLRMKTDLSTLNSYRTINQLVSLTLVSIAVLLNLVGVSRAQEISDPIEPINRGTFWVNDKLDNYLLEPASIVYKKVLPDRVERSVTNFFSNLKFPVRFVSNLIQFKFETAAKQSGRFLVNSTIGIAGLFDVATDWGMEENEDDFGVALGYYGVGEGPYLVLPILGPSNLRDGFGRIVDLAFDPFFWIGIESSNAPVTDRIIYFSKGVNLVQSRADATDAIDTAKDAGLDYYLTIQGAYHQYRRGLIYDGDPPDEYEEVLEEVASEGQSKATE